MENSIIKSENILKNVVYNIKNDVVDESTYRVVLEKPIKGYRTINGERVETDVISYLVPRNVFLAQVLNKLPLLARMYTAAKATFTADADNADKILDFTDKLNMMLAGGKFDLTLEYHAAGEVYVAADGSEAALKVDKYDIQVEAISYGELGQIVAAQIHADEAAKAIATARELLGL